MQIIAFSNTNRNLDDKGKNSPKKNSSETKSNQEPPHKKNCLLQKKIWIPLFVILSIGILAIIGIVIYKGINITNKKKNYTNENFNYLENINLSSPPSKEEEDDDIVTPNLGPLETEFKINTKLNEQRKIKVEQTSKEEIITDGIKEENLIYRITYYDIIFLKK